MAKKCEETPATVVGHRDSLASERSRRHIFVRYPEGYQAGITFAGLFKSPIPITGRWPESPLLKRTRISLSGFQAVPNYDEESVPLGRLT